MAGVQRSIATDVSADLPDARLVFLAACRPLAAFEIFTSLILLLVVLAMSYSNTSFFVDMLLFRAICAAKLLRACVDLASRRFWRWRGGTSIKCWTLVNIPCGILAWPVICGEIYCFMMWYPVLHKSVNMRAGNATPMRAIELAALASSGLLLSSFRYAHWPFRFRRVVPKVLPPTVTSFEVQDVSLECRDSTCAICLDDFTPNCQVGQLPCGHVFHDECVRTWLKTDNAVCPMRCHEAAAVVIGRSRSPDVLSISSWTPSEAEAWP